MTFKWLYGWRQPHNDEFLMQQDPDRATALSPRHARAGASQGRAGVAWWMLVLTFANTGPRGSHFCPRPSRKPHQLSHTLLPTSHFSLSWPCLVPRVSTSSFLILSPCRFLLGQYLFSSVDSHTSSVNYLAQWPRLRPRSTKSCPRLVCYPVHLPHSCTLLTHLRSRFIRHYQKGPQKE
jgi:hypothetical protein